MRASTTHLLPSQTDPSNPYSFNYPSASNHRQAIHSQPQLNFEYQMRHERGSRKQQKNSQPIQFYQTSQHSMSLQSLAHLQKLNEQLNSHFNPPQIKVEEEGQNQIKVYKGKGKRLTRAQNLKNISKHIKRLITNNKDLTIKTLSFFLYQIMGHTEFGFEIIEKNYPLIDCQMINHLSKKYLGDNINEQYMKMVIKNVRRRLYDALNVMMSAKVIERTLNHGMRLSILKHNQITTDMIDQSDEEERTYQRKQYEKNFEEIIELEERISEKRKLLQEANLKMTLLRNFFNRNKYQAESNKNSKFLLPLVFVRNTSRMLVQVEKDQISISSEKKFQVLSDLECLHIILNKNQQWPKQPLFQAKLQEK